MFYSPDHASIHPQQNTSHDAALSLITTTTHNGHFTKQSGEKSNVLPTPATDKACLCPCHKTLHYLPGTHEWKTRPKDR